MRTITEWLGVESNRAYLYRVAGIIGVLALASGWVTSGQEGTVLTDIGLVLGVGGNGLASKHTSRKRKPQAH